MRRRLYRADGSPVAARRRSSMRGGVGSDVGSSWRTGPTDPGSSSAGGAAGEATSVLGAAVEVGVVGTYTGATGTVTFAAELAAGEELAPVAVVPPGVTEAEPPFVFGTVVPPTDPVDELPLDEADALPAAVAPGAGGAELAPGDGAAVCASANPGDIASHTATHLCAPHRAHHFPIVAPLKRS